MSNLESLSETLDELVIRFNEEAKLANEAGKKLLEHVLQCGKALIEAKKIVKAEKLKWIKWVEDNFKDGGYETAKKYMQLAREWNTNEDLIYARETGKVFDNAEAVFKIIRKLKEEKPYDGPFVEDPKEDEKEKQNNQDEAEKSRHQLQKDFSKELNKLHPQEVLILDQVWLQIWEKIYKELQAIVQKHSNHVVYKNTTEGKEGKLSA